MKTTLPRLLILLFAFGFLSGPAIAQSPDEQFLSIYSLIQDGDRLNATGQPAIAREKYISAQEGLKKLQAGYPNWNERVVRFRLRYVEEKIGVLPAPLEAPATAQKPVVPTAPTAPTPPPRTPPTGPDERDTQIRLLQETIQRIEGEKAVLTARLKEALTAQPAAIDPRELAKAEEQIRNLEKEKALLGVTLKQEEARRARLIEPTVVDDLKNALAESGRALNEQRETAAALAREKEILEGRLKDLRREDPSLQSLRSENESLRKQLNARRPPGESTDARVAKLEKDLAETRAALDSNAKAMNKLKEERAALEKNTNDLEKRLASLTKSSAANEKSSATRIAQLEKERDELQTRLKQQGNARAPRATASTPSDRELASLRARLGALEAQKVPYTTEELALFKTPPLAPAKEIASAPKDRPVSAEAAPLIAEAQRAFATQRYAEAEQKYLEVAKLDKGNATALANLAVTQLEQNKTIEAESTLTQALAANPDHVHALTLMGILRFRQDKIEEAFDSLSRATQLDPQNPEALNYLGITLSHKGQRAAAETALRKAVQIAPGYASAHNNLAVIYATQSPPFLELARWHYQKALASGHPKNPEVEKYLKEPSGK